MHSRSANLDLCPLILFNKPNIRGSVNLVLVKDSDNKIKRDQNKD